MSNIVGGTLIAALASSWRDIGGAAIAFTILRGFLFGRTLKTVEYPSENRALGTLKTISIRMPSLGSVKRQICRVNKNVEVSEIKYIARWHDQYFTEPVLGMDQIRTLDDNSFILWSRGPEPIPLHGVTMVSLAQGKHTVFDTTLDSLAKFITDVSSPTTAARMFTEQQAEALLDLALLKDEGLLVLFRTFQSDPNTFRRHALRYMQLKKKAEIQQALANERIRQQLRQQAALANSAPSTPAGPPQMPSRSQASDQSSSSTKPATPVSTQEAPVSAEPARRSSATQQPIQQQS